MASQSLNALMDNIHEIMAATTPYLSQKVAVDTAQFMLDAALRIHPFAQRETPTPESPDLEHDEHLFMSRMRDLTESFVREKNEPVARACRARIEKQLVVHGGDDLALLDEFRAIMKRWARDRDESERQLESTWKGVRRTAGQGKGTRATMRAPMDKSSEDSAGEEDDVRVASVTSCKLPLGGDENNKNSNIEAPWSGRHEQPDRVPSTAPGVMSPGGEKPSVQPGVTRTQPPEADESNGWGVSTNDGVLIGHPPKYPAGLLDWDDCDENNQGHVKAGDQKAAILPRPSTSTTTNTKSACGGSRITTKAKNILGWVGRLGGAKMQAQEAIVYEGRTSEQVDSQEETGEWLKL